MNLIINTSNIVVGGGIQVSKSILEELRSFKDNFYHVFLSAKLEEEIQVRVFPNNFKFYSIPKSPSGLFGRRRVVEKLNNLERTIQPDAVFTVFGPSYWKPRAVHLCGFADGWCYTPYSIAFKQLNFMNKLRTKLLIHYKNYFIKKTSSFLVVETEVAKNNIIKFLTFPKSRIFVVGNTYSNIYDEYNKVLKTKDNIEFKLLTLSSYYKHKNLVIINEVADMLNNQFELDVKFYLTIKNNVYLKYFGANKNIINLGPQLVDDCPQFYASVDAMFLPTLLETFTASYPEAMKMERPILTSDLDFARNICGDAAIYFDPLDVNDIAQKVKLLITDSSLYDDLVERGIKRLEDFETSKSRASKYLICIREILNTRNTIHD